MAQAMGSAAKSASAKWANGTSSSITPGTLVCEVEAAAGHYFPVFKGRGQRAAVVNTEVSIVLTFTDDTTATSTNTSDDVHASQTEHGTAAASVAALVQKKVKKVRVQTSGIGNGARTGTIGALEVAV